MMQGVISFHAEKLSKRRVIFSLCYVYVYVELLIFLLRFSEYNKNMN